MSSSSPTPQPVHLEQSQQAHEPDVLCEGSLSLNQETLNQPDPPPPKFDPGNIPPPQPVLDPEENSPDEEEDDDEDGGEIDEGQEQETPAISSGTASLHVDPPITVPHVSVRGETIASPSNGPNIRRRAGKRKKGKGKGKPNIKKQQAIEEKLQSLLAKLNPIPFIPNKILDFAKHEKLLTKLGLWDFVHIDLDRNIRVDLIAQLIATYEQRASYVNGYRITVSRADLARAFKLPMKKRGNAGGVEVDLEQELLSDDSIGFIIEFVSDWVLLHEDDAWMMPKDVSDWFKVIMDGHPEKVDWASLFWFMVEKELKQGGRLKDCYYVSHLQHLMRCQRKELFLTLKSDDGDGNEEDHEVNKGCLMEGPSTELTLGQDGEKEEGLKDVELMDVEKCKDSDDDDKEEREEEEQGKWFLHGKNELGQHFMQRCSIENAEEFKIFEEKKEEEEEIDEDEDGDEDVNKFHVFPRDDALEGDDGFTGNLLQAMETNQMDMPVDMPHISYTPPFFNNAGKRVMEHDANHISHHANESNKKLRINNSWDHNKPVDFGMCMEQIQHVTESARMLYEEKEQALEQSNMNQQIFLTELQKRDSVIEHLHKTRFEEIQKKDGEIYRLDRELHLMGSVLEGYRKALKETQRVFEEYKEKAQLPEEPTYKDAGPGGLMLTAGEIEKRRREKQEEEYKMFHLVVEQKVKDFEDAWVGGFSEYVEKVDIFESRLTGLEADGNELIELYKKQKTKQTEEDVPEVVEPQTDEKKVPEAEEEYVSIPQTDEEMSEVQENQPNA